MFSIALFLLVNKWRLVAFTEPVVLDLSYSTHVNRSRIWNAGEEMSSASNGFSDICTNEAVTSGYDFHASQQLFLPAIIELS